MSNEVKGQIELEWILESLRSAPQAGRVLVVEFNRTPRHTVTLFTEGSAYAWRIQVRAKCRSWSYGIHARSDWVQLRGLQHAFTRVATTWPEWEERFHSPAQLARPQ